MKVSLDSKDAYKLFHEGTIALADAQIKGFRFDEEGANKQKDILTKRIALQEKAFMKTDIGKVWNKTFGHSTKITSSDQLQVILYDKMGFPILKKSNGGKGSVDEEALKEIGNDDLDLLLSIRGFKKIRDTYLAQFFREAANGYIHPACNLNLVETFRSSSSDPNFQNIPKHDEYAKKVCRSVLLPHPGQKLKEADYSKLEVSISECYHQDPTMMQYLISESNDLHGDMAKQIFFIKEINKKIKGHATLRNASKNAYVFPQFYGDYYLNNAIGLCKWVGLPKQGGFKPGTGIMLDDTIAISDHLIKHKITSFEKFADHMKKIERHFWEKRFPVYNQWKIDWIAKYHKLGYMQTYTGFRCSGLLRNNQIINFPVQGSAFHCLLWSLIELSKFLKKYKMKSSILFQIHDALILSVEPSEEKIIDEALKKIMTIDLPKAWKWIIVPLQIEIETGEINASWANMH